MTVTVDLLSERQRQIAAMLLDGDRPPVIARALAVSESTVRNHLHETFKKMGVKSQQELISKLREVSNCFFQITITEYSVLSQLPAHSVVISKGVHDKWAWQCTVNSATFQSRWTTRNGLWLPTDRMLEALGPLLLVYSPDLHEWMPAGQVRARRSTH